MPQYFRTVPSAKLKVMRVPTETEKGSAAAYYQPGAMDGSRPGTFFANLRDVGETATWTMKTLAIMKRIRPSFSDRDRVESQESAVDPPADVYSAYAEGWALYAEQLAAEIGMYQGDPFGDLGRLQAGDVPCSEAGRGHGIARQKLVA